MRELLLSLLLLLLGQSRGNRRTNIVLNPTTGGYEDVAVMVGAELAPSSCPQIIENIKTSLTAASRSLLAATEGQAYLDKVSIEVPHSWGEADCMMPLSSTCLPPTGVRTGDILVGEDHPVKGAFPFTQQSRGCGLSGDYLYLPFSFLAPSNSSQIGQLIANQWIRLRYGVFEDFDPRRTGLSITSRHHALCRGRTVADVMFAHPDFRVTRTPVNFTLPRFSVTRQAAPRYIIVLENSQTMNMQDNWDYIRTATKKLIVHDLPDSAMVGLVLFNEAAHVAYQLTRLGPKSNAQTRNGLAFSIQNKYNLSPSSGSCVSCGIERAIEALQGAGTPQGAVLIVISQGGMTSLSLGEERDMLELAQQHSLQVFSVALLHPPVTDISLSLERLAYGTGGESFFLVSESQEPGASLASYVRLTDTFREIMARTWSTAPAMIHESQFSPHTEGVYEDHDFFTIDKYTGGRTEFNVFAQNPMENFIKSMSLQDKRGNIFSQIMDNMANFHIFSIYNVPFSLDQNIGMNWSYSMERLPSLERENTHLITVHSYPRDPKEQIYTRFWTSLDTHAVSLSADTPVILYAEVTLGNAPVIEASVVAEIQAINQSGYLTPTAYIPLQDNGNGDPDLAAQDGIYSRYLTQVPSEGRYTVTLRVGDNHGKAFAPLKVYGDKSRSCCHDASVKISNQKLGSFSRIRRGDSFRLHSVNKGSLPPARIMNLEVKMLAKTEELEFAWTSPGEDFDFGKPTSYQLFRSNSPQAFYENLKKTDLVESFSASKPAGLPEQRKILVREFDKNIYFAILAVDKDGNLGEISNVVKAFLPSPVLENDVKTSPHSAGDVSGTILTVEKPNKILLYLIAGIVGFIVLCTFIVMVILLSFRRKKAPEDMETNKSLGTTTEAGFSGLQDTTENVCTDPEVKHYLLGNSNQDSVVTSNGPTHSSLIRDDIVSLNENPYGYSPHQLVAAYGWAANTNPYVHKDHNETYASIGSYHNTSQDSYIRGFQPMYAQAIPKNLRPQHIYSNAAIIARSSPHGSQCSIEGGRSTVTFLAQPPESGLSRVSPDSQHSSSDQAPTPTKSILKKPKNLDCLGDSVSDRDSQHSQSSQNSQQSRTSQCSSIPRDSSLRSAHHPSQLSTLEQDSSLRSAHPPSTLGQDDSALSIEKTYLETSFEFGGSQEEMENKANIAKKAPPPPTLPKPGCQDLILSSDTATNSLDKKIRNCTQV